MRPAISISPFPRSAFAKLGSRPRPDGRALAGSIGRPRLPAASRHDASHDGAPDDAPSVCGVGVEVNSTGLKARSAGSYSPEFVPAPVPRSPVPRPRPRPTMTAALHDPSVRRNPCDQRQVLAERSSARVQGDPPRMASKPVAMGGARLHCRFRPPAKYSSNRLIVRTALEGISTSLSQAAMPTITRCRDARLISTTRHKKFTRSRGTGRLFKASRRA